MKIPPQNVMPADEQAQSIHQRRPELAELAARVAEGKSDLGERRRLADAYLRERLYSHAYNLYRQIQSEAPDDAGVHLALAFIFDNWSDYQVAIQHAKTAVRLEPHSAQGWDLLGRIHLHAGELDSAQSAWTTALQINAEDASVLANAGYVFLLERNWQQARVFLERALERDGSLPEARNNLGIVLSKLGDYPGALQQFMALNRPAVAYNNLGVVKLDEGLPVEAANAFKQALTYEPDYLIAQDNLTEVQAYLPHPAIVGLPPFDVSAAQPQSATPNAEAESPAGATVPPNPAPQPVVLGNTQLDTSLSTSLSIPAVATEMQLAIPAAVPPTVESAFLTGLPAIHSQGPLPEGEGPDRGILAQDPSEKCRQVPVLKRALPTTDDLFSERGVPPMEIRAPVIQGAVDAHVSAEPSEQFNRPIAVAQIGDVFSRTTQPQPQETRALHALEHRHLSVVLYWVLAILGMALAISRKSIAGMVVAIILSGLVVASVGMLVRNLT